jgi:hypothetical protein
MKLKLTVSSVEAAPLPAKGDRAIYRDTSLPRFDLVVTNVIAGVRGTYDRHAYHAEKALAFEALAAQIDRIVNPQANVIPIRAPPGGGT